MRGPARKAKEKIDYKTLGDIGKGVSFFSSPAYTAGTKPKAAAAPKKSVRKAAAGGAKKKSRSRAKGEKTYADVVYEAIVMKGKPIKGASLVAISTYLKEHHPSKADPVHIRLTIKRGVASGALIRTGGSYRLVAGLAGTLGLVKPKAPVAAASGDGAAAGAAAASSPAAKKRAAPKKKAAAAAGAAAKPSAKVFDSKTDAPESGHKWQYYDGAKGGWNDYDAGASDVVDAAFREWEANPYTDVRSIGSGQWQYQIDFTNMKQTNIQHAAHTQRDIRRVKK